MNTLYYIVSLAVFATILVWVVATEGESSISKPKPSELPTIGSPCDQDNCNRTGYCQEYRVCVNGRWEQEACQGDAVWNPEGPGWGVHGGNCDYMTNLPMWLQTELRKDPECVGCYWKEAGECSQMYNYQPPGLDAPNHQTLNCTEGFVFDKTTESCQLCNFVIKQSTGDKCC